jgi:hypothetical protein
MIGRSKRPEPLQPARIPDLYLHSFSEHFYFPYKEVAAKGAHRRGAVRISIVSVNEACFPYVRTPNEDNLYLKDG